MGGMKILMLSLRQKRYNEVIFKLIYSYNMYSFQYVFIFCLNSFSGYYLCVQKENFPGVQKLFQSFKACKQIIGVFSAKLIFSQVGYREKRVNSQKKKQHENGAKSASILDQLCSDCQLLVLSIQVSGSRMLYQLFIGGKEGNIWLILLDMNLPLIQDIRAR